MLTNAERLDALESGMNAANTKLHTLTEFYETRDAVKNLMDEIRTMSQRLKDVEDALDIGTQIISTLEV